MAIGIGPKLTDECRTGSNFGPLRKGIPKTPAAVKLQSKNMDARKISNNISGLNTTVQGFWRIMIGASEVPLNDMRIRHESDDHMVRVQAFDDLGRPLCVFNGILESRKGVVVIVDIPFVPDPPSEDRGMVFKSVHNAGNIIGPCDLAVKR
ncbi:MAG: hypothetical protein BWY42_01542 [Candidatus Omnitrophica bacterium ADurb.Bin277]|nr:MAG: hypothetical protein BWY42_01542 [Candidatus Omnitrophica bacterium ADurb.Bin277]